MSDGTVPAGMPWWKSNAIRTVLVMAAYYLLLWLVQSADAKAFDWWVLLKSESGALVALLANLLRSDVVAPVAILNGLNPKVPG